MSIFASTNFSDWGQLDGVYIDDTSPPPSVTGVPSGTAILVGQFERGAPGIQTVGSVAQLYQLYGNNLAYSGIVALQNKKFGFLKVVRAIAASGSANAAHTFQDGSSNNIITFTALWAGAYGNSLKVTIAAGSTSGSKYTIHDNNPGAVWPDEIYDNVVITAIGVSNPFAQSNLITATVVSSAHGEPSTASATSLSSGSDGSIANTDYQIAIQNQTQSSGVGNILFLDAYNATRNGYVKASMAATTDKMGLVAGAAGDSVSTAVTDVANVRDVDGRMIYCFPYVNTTINGASMVVNGASFYASLLSQIAPNIDPAYAANSQYLSGIDSLDVTTQLTRSDYITLNAAGISAFEVDSDIGIKIKSGVVTQISDSSRIMIFRRRMADYIIQSLAKYLKNYQNAPNSKQNAINVNAAFSSFNKLLEGPAGSAGIVPKDSEVSSGKASLIDVKSLNTDDSIAAGFFYVIYKRRIYSSMRYIVLQTQIGESVVVTESNG